MNKWDTLAALFSLCILVAMVVACCSCVSRTGECEEVHDTINARAKACAADFEVRGDCDAANYVDGDVQACLDAVKAASCEELRQVVRDKCLIFGHGGL